MAVSGEQYRIGGFKALVDLRNHQHHIVRMSGARQVSWAASAGGDGREVFGVLWNKPNSGNDATIVRQGETPVAAGAAITRGLWFTTNASGRATSAASGDMVAGIALEGAANGDLFDALLMEPFVLLRT